MNKFERILELKRWYTVKPRRDPDVFYGHIRSMFGVDPRELPGYAGWRIETDGSDVILDVLLEKPLDQAITDEMSNIVDVWLSTFSGKYIAEFTLKQRYNMKDESEAWELMKR